MYILCNWLTWLLLGLTSRREVVGLENFPAEGPVLVMANHISWLDPPALGLLLPRRIRYMAKEELFRNWFVRWVVAGYGAFSIRRGEIDRQALREATKVLADGGVLGIFPEGTRSRDGKLQTGQPGVALLALRSRAPVVPVAVIGTDEVWHLSSVFKRPRFSIVVGKPFRLTEEEAPGRKDLSGLSDGMMVRLAALVPPEMRGAYGDRCENVEVSGVAVREVVGK